MFYFFFFACVCVAAGCQTSIQDFLQISEKCDVNPQPRRAPQSCLPDKSVLMEAGGGRV